MASMYLTWYPCQIDSGCRTETSTCSCHWCTCLGEWEIIHCPVTQNTKRSVYESQGITMYLIIRRKPLFYIVHILVPCMIISCLSVGAFSLPNESCEKTNMSISLLLGESNSFKEYLKWISSRLSVLCSTVVFHCVAYADMSGNHFDTVLFSLL